MIGYFDVFYRFEVINWSVKMESFVLKYFTKLLQFGSTGMFWDMRLHRYVEKATSVIDIFAVKLFENRASDTLFICWVNRYPVDKC